LSQNLSPVYNSDTDNLCSLAGRNPNVAPAHYSVEGSPVHKLFGVFTALSVMAGVYGVALIPEIQVWLTFHKKAPQLKL
jgi:hypothetical protein